MDPFRDPYHALAMYGSTAAAAAAAAAAKDPLREARERELLRMNPLGSMILSEQERARLSIPPLGAPPLPPHSAPGIFPGLATSNSGATKTSAAPSPSPLGMFPPPFPGLPTPPRPPSAAAAGVLPNGHTSR